MSLLDTLFPGLPPTPGDMLEDIGDFFEGVAGFFSSSGPSAESIAVGALVKTIMGGPGAQSMYDAQRATRRQVDVQADLAGQAHELVAKLETAWTGPSASGAKLAIRSFADVADESSRVLTSNARNIERQVDGYERMRNSLEPMPDPPPTKGAFNPDFSGAAKKRIRAYQHMAERNRQRYSGFVDETKGNIGDLDAEYGPLPGFDGRNPGYPGGGYPGMPGYPGGGRPGGLPDYRPPSWPGGSSPGGSGGYTPGGGYGRPFDPGGFDPGRIGEFDGTTAAASYGSGGSGGLPGGLPGGGGAGLPGGGGAGVPSIPGGAGSGADAGAMGAQSGVGRPGGPAGAGGFGPRGGAAGFGPRGGGMAGGGAPMGGGGRGQGGEDQDYQRKSWLQENDPESIFGSDEMTIPPVIGLDEYEQ